MSVAHPRTGVLTICALLAVAAGTSGQDWPQWRGPARDAKATGFTPPKTWPAELTKKWSVAVGDGVATPALVDDRLYVFSRQDGSEVIRCLNAATGEEIWRNEYESGGATGPASGYSGPRSSPAVADGKVVTLGVRGILSCLSADSGEVLWRKNEFRDEVPRFFTSSSPILIDGLCIAALGGERGGGLVAYDLASGDRKWEWLGDGPSYASPVLMTVGDTQAIVTPTAESLVAVGIADGRLLWQIRYSQGRYNATTPIVEGQTVIYAGPARGTTAEKLEKQGDELAASEVWSNPDNSLQYNTPVLKDGLLLGISNTGSLFCVRAKTGETAWTASLSGERRDEASSGERRDEAPPREGGRRGRGGRGGGGGGYGSVVDAGAVLFALTPSGRLVVFEPSAEEFKKIADYKVADEGTYAYPVVSESRIFIKDRDSLTLWTIE